DRPGGQFRALAADAALPGTDAASLLHDARRGHPDLATFLVDGRRVRGQRRPPRTDIRRVLAESLEFAHMTAENRALRKLSARLASERDELRRDGSAILS